MAEQNQEITYLPYGQDEISQQDLMTSLANGVPSYLESKRWAKKDKYRQAWLNAYQDIINHGLTGASNSSGVWAITHGGNVIDLNTLSNIDREMYQDAAWYIQQKMSQMTPRSKQVEKKEDKKLEKYNFMNQFFPQFLNNRFGGDESIFRTDWESYDKRGENGLRGTENRKGILIEELDKYKRNLLANTTDYDFEGTAFANKDDVIRRIDEAIAAIKSPDLNDDNPKLNALGLSYNALFSNGGNDIYGTDENGKQWTYADYYADQAKQKAEAEKAATDAAKAKLAQQKANQYIRFRFFGHNLAGKPLSPEHSNMDYLNGLAAKDDWTGDEQSELVGVFKLAAKNNQLQDLTREELQRFGSAYANHPGRLKKIDGLNGIYWDSIGNRIIKPYTSGNQPKITFQDVLDQNNPELLEQKRQELQNSKKLADEDWNIIAADTVSMIGDLVSLGGGYAGALGGATTILSDLYADVNRGKDFWDITKNLAKNTAWGFAGLIPGVKLAKLGKRAAQLYALFNSWGIISDPDVHKSWQKLIKGESFTSHDLENLKWTLHAFTGAHNTVRSHYSDKKLDNKLNKNKVIVETKNGQKPITIEDQKAINRAGGRGGQAAAEKKFKDIVHEEAKEGSFEFSPEGRRWYNPARYSQKIRNAVSNETKLEGTPAPASRMTIGRMLVYDRNKPFLANPFSQQTYRNWWTEGGPNRGYTTMALGRTYQGLNNTKQNALSDTPSQNNEFTPEKFDAKDSKINPSLNHGWGKNSKGEDVAPVKNPKPLSEQRETTKQYREIMNDKFSNNELKSGEYTIGGEKVQVVKQTDGTFNVIRKGNIIGNYRNQIELQRKIRDIIKENSKKNPTTNKPNISAKEMGKILRSLKAKGWLKQGGTINTSLDTIIEDFIKNNNI